jgi:FAD synthase
MTGLMKCKKSQSTVRMDVVFTYGRFNPPHLGHKMMIEEIIKKARQNEEETCHSRFTFRGKHEEPPPSCE